MYVILSVRDNCPDEIKGVHYDADAAYKAFKQHLREAFQGEPMTEEDLDAACDLGYEPWGNGFIAILDLSNAEADNPLPPEEANLRHNVHLYDGLARFLMDNGISPKEAQTAIKEHLL